MSIIIVNKFLINVLTFGFARAITLYPFILLKYKEDRNNRFLINHEEIHIKQQAELWVIGFYILYLLYYRKGKKAGLSHTAAYNNIPFEKEASENEYKLSYPRLRTRNAWRKYKQ